MTTYGKRAQLFASRADVLFILEDAIEGPMEPVPDVLLNLGKLPERAGIGHDPSAGLVLGAMTCLIDLIEHPVIQAQYPLVQAASQVPRRNCATPARSPAIAVSSHAAGTSATGISCV